MDGLRSRSKRKASAPAAAASASPSAAAAAAASRSPIRKRRMATRDEEEEDDDDEEMAAESSASEDDGSDWELDKAKKRRRGSTPAAAKKRQRVAAKVTRSDDMEGSAAGSADGGDGAGGAAAAAAAGQIATDDVDMEGGDMDVAEEGEKGPSDVLAALDELADTLEEQLARVKNLRDNAKRVFDVRGALSPNDTPATQSRVQDLDRNMRVLVSMLLGDAEEQVRHNGVVAKQQTEQALRKMKTLEDKMDRINNDIDDDLTIEGLPEALWLSDGERVGVGAYLGFLPCVTSLIAVNTYFSSLVQQPAMHPMLELNSSPKQHIAERWTGRLSECREVRVDHHPTPSLLHVLESMAPSLRVLRVKGWGRRNQEGHLVWRRGRGQVRKQVWMMPNKTPLTFSQLHTATIINGWSAIAEQRNYSLPALRDLSVVDLSTHGPRSWIAKASGGLTALHVTSDLADTKLYGEVTIEDATQSLQGTPSASSLTSLTGVAFRADVAWFNIDLQRFIDVICDNGGGGAVGAGTAGAATGGGGRLRHIEFGMRPISSVAQIQKLHRFRTTCLAPNAFESYHLSDGRDPRRQRQPLAIQLPFAGNINDLQPSIATAQALARHATHGTLHSHGGGHGHGILHSHGGVHGQQAGQMWGSLVWAGITQLRIESRGHLPLPSYITGNPASYLPNVRSIVVAEEEVG